MIQKQLESLKVSCNGFKLESQTLLNMIIFIPRAKVSVMRWPRQDTADKIGDYTSKQMTSLCMNLRRSVYLVATINDDSTGRTYQKTISHVNNS